MHYALKWIKSDGTEQLDNKSLAAATYYAEVNIGNLDSRFSITLAPDASIIATASLESTDFDPTDALAATTASTYSTADDYWIDQTTALGALTINAASTACGWQVVSAVSLRYRVKLIVATAGKCPGRVTAKKW